MAERAPDPALEESTNKWMAAGFVIMVLLVLVFPVYRFYEPSARETARELHIASLAEHTTHRS